MLITAGASLETRNFKGETALIRAAKGCNQETVKALIAAGASLNAENA
jgi:ankyrin repeat protein